MSISIQVGFFTIAVHFWAPTFKWGVSIANIYDFWTPAEQLSYPQQTGMWSAHHLFSFPV